MLIINANAFADAHQLLMHMPWQGPRVLISTPESGFSPGALERLSDDFFVIEHLEPVSSVATLLAETFRLLPWLLAEHPLLYIDRQVDTSFLAKESQLGQSLAHEVAADLTDEGRLTMLRLGEMIATSPLLPEFFAFLKDRSVNDTALVSLLDTAFAWTRT